MPVGLPLVEAPSCTARLETLEAQMAGLLSDGVGDRQQRPALTLDPASDHEFILVLKLDDIVPDMKPDTKSSEDRIGRLERRMRELEAIVGSPGRLIIEGLWHALSRSRGNAFASHRDSPEGKSAATAILISDEESD